MQAYAQPTLLEVLSPQLSRPAVAWRNVALAIAGSLLLTLSAKLQIPFWPVPMTMQTFVVLVIGTAFGWRLGAATVALYLLEGAVGLPVFAGTPERGIGLAYMMGPTAGFLVGFVIAAWIVGFLAERGWDRNFLTCGAAMIAGHVAISLSGVVWLAILFGTTKAIDIGLVPFLASSALKTALGTATMPLIWRIVARRP